MDFDKLEKENFIWGQKRIGGLECRSRSEQVSLNFVEHIHSNLDKILTDLAAEIF